MTWHGKPCDCAGMKLPWIPAQRRSFLALRRVYGQGRFLTVVKMAALLIGYLVALIATMILTLGLVVDDPIANVDNIQRHILMRRRNPFDATLAAVKELLPPVIMSTLAIIVSFLPMFFITGMMGPYMEPMAINVPLTVN